MRVNYTLLTVVCLALSVPLAWMVLNRRSAEPRVPVVRFASFNVAMNRRAPGEMLAELRSGKSKQGRRIAEVVQRCAVDVILLCEVDRDAAAEAAKVLAEQYLAVSQSGQAAIEFPYRYCGEVNTGLPTGRDVDGDGAELRHLDRSVEVDGESGNILEGDFPDLAVVNFGFHRNQAGRRLE